MLFVPTLRPNGYPPGSTGVWKSLPEQEAWSRERASADMAGEETMPELSCDGVLASVKISHILQTREVLSEDGARSYRVNFAGMQIRMRASYSDLHPNPDAIF